MAKKPTKFRSGGSSDRSQARFDRKVADIDSDLARALRGASEREAEVARAKHRQRMADARDDLAKWTGGDRSQTRAAERGAEAELTRTRRQGATFKPSIEAPSIAAPKSGAQIAAATTPAAKTGASGSQTFAQAFRAAREGGGKTFTWRGKSYTTKVAGEGSPGPRPGSGGKPPKGNSPVSQNLQRAAFEQVTGNSPTPGNSTLTPAQQQRANAYRNAFQGRRAPVPTAPVTPAKPSPRRLTVDEVTATDFSGRKVNLTPEQRLKLEAAAARAGTRSSFAKGGSIDGIAKRGKTRAKRKK